MPDSDFPNLPYVVLYEIFDKLKLSDRIAASSTCSRWREGFFFYENRKRRKFDLSTAHCCQEKIQFLKKFQCCRWLRITYVANDFDEVVHILKDWPDSLRLTSFQMVGSGKPGNLDLFRLQFTTSVYLLLENCHQLDSCFLFHLIEFNRFKNIIHKNRSKLSSVGIGRVLDPVEPMPCISSVLCGLSLRNLHLDGTWVTDQAVAGISKNLSNLKILSFFLTEDNLTGNILPAAWNEFNTALPRCQIRVVYHGINTPCLRNILSKARNITHLRLLYCSQMFQDACIDAMMRVRLQLHTLKSIWAITDLTKRELFPGHPFVVCAWRFKHLKEILLSGALFDEYDLVGMVRMNPSLYVHIAKEDITMQDESGYRKVTREKLLRLSADLAIPKGNWFPMDDKLFNDASLPQKDREAAALREALLTQ